MSDTLTSKATARVIDLVSEGVIESLTDKQIYLNKVVLQNADNSYNFEGVRTVIKSGGMNQTPLKGFREIENETGINVEVLNGTPYTIALSDNTLDAVVLTCGVNALVDQDPNDGEQEDATVNLEFWLQPSGGTYAKVGAMEISGVIFSNYDRSKRIELPSTGFPFNLQVRRITADSVSVNLQNKTYFRSYTLIYDYRLNYAGSAVVGLEIDAEVFGDGQFPERRYRPKGIQCRIPSNYNPTTRVYTGLWDGAFTTAYTVNPVWVTVDVATQLRYGLGDVFSTSNIDKFGLYAIAQYCDGMVPDGKGGTEPRFEYHGVINSSEDAARVLDVLASVFRGMIYWGTGAVLFTSDKPRSIKRTVGPANIIGKFAYSGTARKTRYSAAVVSWNDPANFGELSYEYVQRESLIEKYGFREIALGAVGCASQGQANRVGEWYLDTCEHETESCVFTCSMDQMDFVPGDIMGVSDPAYMGLRYFGRIVATAGDLKSLTVDAPVDIANGQTYTISIVLPDLTTVSRTLTNAVGANQTVLTWAAALPQTPVANAVWSLASTSLNPRPFQVIAIYEKDDNFEIHTLFHDVTKFARVERDKIITPPSYTIGGVLLPPTNAVITEFTRFNGDDYVSALTLSFKKSLDPRANGYQLQVWDGNDKGWQRRINLTNTSYIHFPVPKGAFKFRVRSLGKFDQPSAWLVSSTYTVLGFANPNAATSLSTIGKSNRIIVVLPDNPNRKFKRWIIYASQTNLFSSAAIVGYSRDNRFTHDGLTQGDVWYYWVRAQNKQNDVSERYPAPPTNTGIAGLVGYIAESDTDPTTLASPGAVTLSQVRTRDKNGNLVSVLQMATTAPAGATARTRYIWFVAAGSAGATPITIVTQDIRAELRGVIVGTVYYVTVCAISHSNKLGTLSFNAPPPNITILRKPTTDMPTPSTVTATATLKNVKIDWDDVDTDLYPDYDMTFLYRSTTTTTPTPGTTTPYKKIKAGSYVDNPGAARNYWVAHKDKDGIFTAISAMVSGTPLGITETDITPTTLAAPANLQFDQNPRRRDENGQIDISGTASVNALTGAMQYGWELMEDGAAIDYRITDDNKCRFSDLQSNHDYRVRCRGYSSFNNPGTYCTRSPSLTFTKRTTAPSDAVGLTVSGGHEKMKLDWTRCTDTDYKHTEIYEAAAGGNFASAGNPIARISGDSWTRPNLGNNVTKDYFILHVSRSDVSGARFPTGSTGISGTTRRLVNDDYTPNSVVTKTIKAGSTFQYRGGNGKVSDSYGGGSSSPTKYYDMLAGKQQIITGGKSGLGTCRVLKWNNAGACLEFMKLAGTVAGSCVGSTNLLTGSQIAITIILEVKRGSAGWKKVYSRSFVDVARQGRERTALVSGSLKDMTTLGTPRASQTVQLRAYAIVVVKFNQTSASAKISNFAIEIGVNR